MLGRRVYQTDFYYKKYEHQARENMMKELNKLKGE